MRAPCLIVADVERIVRFGLGDRVEVVRGGTREVEEKVEEGVEQ